MMVKVLPIIAPFVLALSFFFIWMAQFSSFIHVQREISLPSLHNKQICLPNLTANWSPFSCLCFLAPLGNKILLMTGSYLRGLTAGSIVAVSTHDSLFLHNRWLQIGHNDFTLESGVFKSKCFILKKIFQQPKRNLVLVYCAKNFNNKEWNQ